MKKTELKSLIREVVEEQRFIHEMRMINEDAKKFVAGKALEAVLRPLITMAMRANPDLKNEFAQRFKSPEDLAAAFQDSKIQAQAEKDAKELASNISEAEGGGEGPAAQVKKTYDVAKSKFGKYLNVGTAIALIAAVAWLVTRAYISNQEGGWKMGFGLIPKALGIFGKNPYDDYRMWANVIWGIIFAGGLAYSKGKAMKQEPKD